MKLVDRGACEIAETDGVNVVLHASVSSPPGSTLLVEFTGLSSPCRVKVRGCRKLADDERFRIEGRFVDLTREQRQALGPS